MASKFTLTVLGSGTMGIAILSGILSHLEDQSRGIQFLPPAKLVDNTTPSTPTEELPSKLIPKDSLPASAAMARKRESTKNLADMASWHPKFM